MSGYEEQLLARAEVLEDTSALVQAITAVLAGAQGAGVDPAAVTSLAAATRALDPGADTGHDVGSNQDRRPGGGYSSDGEFLEAVSDAEADAGDRLREVQQLREHVTPTLDAAQAALEDARQALAAAHAMATTNPCDGCHPAKAAAIAAAEAAIAAAEERIRSCEAALDLLDPLVRQVQRALELLQQVPRTSARSTNWCTRSCGKAGSCPRWPAGSKVREPGSGRGNTAAWIILLAAPCAVVIAVLAGL
jgi:hypothetical protein